MEIRRFRDADASALAELATQCARGETDFVLNPLWETEAELHAEFARFGIDATQHLLVAEEDGDLLGLAGFLRHPGERVAGLFCPIVKRSVRGRGLGGELLRAARDLATRELGIQMATAGIGTRNRAGYSLLTSHGFRPVRQHYLMRCDARPETAALLLDGPSLENAKPDDAEAILEIYHACGFAERSTEAMRRALEGDRHVHAVVRSEGRVVAFVEIETHWPRRVWVAFVGVDPSLRDRGLGTALVAESVANQFDAGAEKALLMLSPANRTALRAYEKVGFRRHRLIDVLECSFT